MLNLDWSFLLKTKQWGKGCFAEDYLLLAAVCAQLKPRTVLEIGTSAGMGSVVLARCGCRVTTVDVDQSRGRTNLELLEPHERERIAFVEARSDEALAQFAREGQRFDLVFVDGDHSYGQARKDWQNTQEMTTVWVLHDTSQFAGLQALVAEIRAAGGYEVFQFVSAPGHHHDRHGRLVWSERITGVTLVQKLDNLATLPHQARRDGGRKITWERDPQRRLLFGRHKDLDNPHYAAWREFLAQAGRWDEEHVRAWQVMQAQKILAYAMARTEGYQELYAGIAPEEIQTLEDLRRLPFTNKETLRDDPERFSVELPDRWRTTTGGSTGVPVTLYRDPQTFGRELASKAHQYERAGWSEGARQMTLRGLIVETPDRMEWVPELRELRCSSFHLLPEHIERFYRAAQRLQIRWLRCYPSAGYLFARELKRRGWKLPLAGVLCASERLYDFQRELFRQVFGCRTFSHYGHYELGALAGYCEHADTYHVLPFYGYAELLDQEGRPVTEPGRVGEIVATSFIARATPIIRYRTGDLAVWGGVGCEACGRPYPIWREVEGRAQEFVVTRDGRLLSNSALIFHNEVYDHIQQFEYYQEEPGVVTFRYIPGPGWNGDTARRTRRLLEEKLQNVALHLAPVERMTLSERGKHGAIVQRLALEAFQGVPFDERLRQ